jgi:hypothetical protein
MKKVSRDEWSVVIIPHDLLSDLDTEAIVDQG